MQIFVSWKLWMKPIPIGSVRFMLCGFWKYHMTAVLKSLGKSIVKLRNAERLMVNYVKFVISL